MIGQVLVDGRPGWRCLACGSEWQVPPHNDAAEYADAEREWMQAHKRYCEIAARRLDDAAAQPLLELADPTPAPQAAQLTMMEDPGNGAQETTGTRLPTVRG